MPGYSVTAVKRWGWIITAAVVVAIGVAVGWLWLSPYTADTQAQAKITTVATAVAALAAIFSALAAFASLGSARASNEVAQRALRAVALHNRPTDCWYRTLSSYDDPKYLSSSIDPRFLSDITGDEVAIWIDLQCLSGVKAPRFAYVTPEGQQPELSVVLGEPLLLPGVRPIATVPNVNIGITSVNVSRWTITCRDRETNSLWRASGETEDGKLYHDDYLHGVEFELVDE